MNYDKNCPATIEAMFSSIAADYDKGNAVSSLGLHFLWNRRLIKAVLRHKKPRVHLDLCCGTGAIGIPLARKAKKTLHKLHLLDFSKPMVERALHNALKRGVDPLKIDIHWADAGAIPLPTESVDSITMAYGLRNIQNPLQVLAEIKRVLKPGGVFGLLELTRPENRILAPLHKFFLRKILPRLVSLTSKNKAAYQYLVGSIESFMSSENLRLLMISEGLVELELQPQLQGVAHLLVVQKR